MLGHWPVWLGIVLSVLLIPATVRGQPVERMPGAPVSWDVVLDGPVHQISGVVLKEPGSPREDAVISIDGLAGGALGDSEGRFSLSVPGAGEWVIRIRGIGTAPIQETLVIPPGAGVRMVVSLPDRVMPLCALYVCNHRCRDLAIEVSDADTGLTPQAEVTVRLEHESGVLTHTTPVDSHLRSGPRRFGLEREITTQGFPTVEVTAPGYVPWRSEPVWLELTEECHPRVIGGPREVRLERIDL